VSLEPKALLELIKKTGVPVAAAIAAGWWAWHVDGVTRVERAAAEQAFRTERREQLEVFRSQMQGFALEVRRIADNCVKTNSIRRARADDEE
jgi:hypothetical protein